jgi:hypothetical protein
VPSANNVNGRTAVTLHGNTLGASANSLSAQLATNQTSFGILTRLSAGLWTSNAADIVNGSVLVVSLTYMTD